MSKTVEYVVEERTQSAKDKIELKNITFTTGMDSHRRTSCAVQPGNPTTNSAVEKAGMSRKRSTGQKPCNSGLEKFDQTIQTFKDTDTAKKYYKRKTKMLSSAAAVMGILAVALALLDIELTIRGTDTAQDLSAMDLSVILNNPFRLSAAVVKSSLSVLSLLTSITIYRMNVNELRYLVVRNIYLRSEKFVMTSLFPTCLAEVAICLFHVPPFLDHYGMPYELQLLVFLRLYLIAKYVKEHNMFVDNQATAVFASVTQTEISSVFLVKAYFLKFPFRLIFTFYLLNIFLGGYFVYVIERTHNAYLDTVWMLVVTMTTLGFGDVVPKKLLARAFVGFASVLGIFLMALFISVVHEALQLKQQEKRILATMENAEHLNRKKNLAATCIQSTWKLYRFKKENEDTIEWGDWFKTQKFRRFEHKMAEDIRKWRFLRRSWSRDDYWRKFFLADDIAMLLTDVSRSVGNVELFLQKQTGVRRISKSSFKRSSGSVESPPPILEEEKTSSHVESQQKDRCRKVHAVLVDPWARQTNFAQNQRPLPPSSSTPLPNQLHFVNPLDKCTNGHRNHVPYGKFMDVNDNSRVTFRTRKESDPIDRGEIPADALHEKIESLENALDQIYRRMKTELRDVRDSLASLSPLQSSRAYSYSHGFGYQRTKEHADV